MSRSGYGDDCDFIDLYRGTVERALHGKRGQQFLRELALALDALPVKRLIRGELINSSGECCAIGAVCKLRAIDASTVDYDNPEKVGQIMGIARSMAAEIAFENDEVGLPNETPESRWARMRQWVTGLIEVEAEAAK